MLEELEEIQICGLRLRGSLKVLLTTKAITFSSSHLVLEEECALASHLA